MAKIHDALTALYVWFQTRIEREEGQGLVEYALIIALVAIALIVALQLLGGSIGNTLRNVSTTLQGAI